MEHRPAIAPTFVSERRKSSGEKQVRQLPVSPQTPDKYRPSLKSVRESAKALEAKLRIPREKLVLHQEQLKKEKWIRQGQTFVILVSFFVMGMYYSLFGPTAQDIAVLLSEDLCHVLLLLSARGAGSFVGAVAGGTFLRPLNPQVLFAIFDFLLFIACVGLSHFHTLLTWLAFFAVGGVAFGAVQITGILWITALWTDRSGAMLQASSFMHCLGCALGPVVGEHFLTARLVRGPVDNPLLQQMTYLTELEDKEFIFVTYAYLIVGLCSFSVVTMTVILLILHPAPEDLRPAEFRNPVVPCSGVVLLLSACLCLYVAMEVHYGQLLAPFALLMGYTKTAAAYATSLFWALYAIVRGVCALWLLEHGPVPVLLASNVFLLIASVGLALFGAHESGFYVGTAAAGAFLGPMLPAILLLMHDYSGVSTTRFVCVMFVVAASSSGCPLCVGYFIETYPLTFYYIFLGLVAASCFLVCATRLALYRVSIDGHSYTFLASEGQR